MQGSYGGGGHVVNHIAPLLPERRRDREHPFGKPTAGGAVRAKAAPAPEHGGPQRALRRVVGRLDPGDVDEGPERCPEFDEVATRRRGLAVRGLGPAPQPALDAAPQWPHRVPKARARQGAIPHAVPAREHRRRVREQGAPQARRRPAPFGEGCPLPPQVRPAQLPVLDRPGRVRAPAVGDHEGLAAAQQAPRRRRAAPRVDQEHRRPGAAHHPQPRPLAPLAPPRLVDVDDFLLLHVPVGLGDRRGHRRTHRLLACAHRAQGQVHTEQVGHHPHRRPPAEVVHPGAHGHRRRQPGAEGPARHARRQRGGRRRPASGTGQGVQLILRDVGPDGRYLRHLMPPGRGVHPAQGGRTPRAPWGLDRHDQVDGGLGQQQPLLPFVPRLPARPAPRRRARGEPTPGGRIRRGRPRGVLRALPQALFQLGHPGQQLLDDVQRLLQRPGPQVGRQWSHTTTCMLAAPESYYIFDGRAVTVTRRYSRKRLNGYNKNSPI